MNFAKISAVFIICSLLLASCDHKEESACKGSTISFDVSDWDKKQVIPQKIVKEIRFVPLETSEENLIRHIDKLIIHKNTYYILDVKYGKKILIFNKDGKFIKSIGVRGKDPGEYISLGDFTIDTKNNRLAILDSNSRKVLLYNLLNFELLEEIKINFWASNLSFITPNSLVFYSKDQVLKNGDRYSIARLDLRDNSYEWFLRKNEYDQRISKKFSLFKSENIFYTPYLKDVVYKITNSNVLPFATFNFGKDKIPSDRLKRIETSDLRGLIELMKEGKWTCSVTNFMESKNFLTFNLKLKGTWISAIYSKETSNIFYGRSYEGLLQRIRMIQNIAVNEEEFISSIDATSFRRIKDDILNSGDKSLIDNYQQIFEKVTEQSNPVILLIRYNKL